jgi:mannosylglycoprotein endo-beta-mannosidase
LQIFGDQKTLDLLPYRGGNSRSADLGSILEARRQIWWAPIKRRKNTLLTLLQDLDKKAEIDSLSDHEIDLKHYPKEWLISLLRVEEIKWYQRATVKTLLEGDANTRFFHLIANGKHRKQLIYRLEDDNGVVVNSDHLKCHITNYYKTLFGIPEQTEITLMEDQIHDIPQVSDEENEILIADFIENEVREAVFQMEHNKSPGPDGFPAEFYQVFWG